MESVEIQMARLQERMEMVTHQMTRRESSDELLRTLIERIDRRMEKVEGQLATSAPTIEEFITIKNQVKGAGFAGRWLWAIGGFLISTVFAFREQIRDWFVG